MAANYRCPQLWAVLVLAERYEVDLEAAYVDTMDDLADRLS